MAHAGRPVSALTYTKLQIHVIFFILQHRGKHRGCSLRLLNFTLLCFAFYVISFSDCPFDRRYCTTEEEQEYAHGILPASEALYGNYELFAQQIHAELLLIE